MALIVEDGTQIANAESYVSVAEANAYLLGHTLLSEHWFAISNIDRERALRVASQWIDAEFGLRFVGYRESASQGLAWPRRGVLSHSGLEIPPGIPRKLKAAVFEAAAVWSETGIPLTVEAVGGTPGSSGSSGGSATVQKETVKIGPLTISQEFSGAGQEQSTTTATSGTAVYPLVERILMGGELVERFERGAGSSRMLERF